MTRGFDVPPFGPAAGTIADRSLVVAEAPRPSVREIMVSMPSAPPAWPDPRALSPCLEAPAARRLDPRDREGLRAALMRATRTAGPDDDLIVADGHPVGRVLPHGSVVLYRPAP